MALGKVAGAPPFNPPQQPRGAGPQVPDSLPKRRRASALPWIVTAVVAIIGAVIFSTYLFLPVPGEVTVATSYDPWDSSGNRQLYVVPITCPQDNGVTFPNRLADGSFTCSMTIASRVNKTLNFSGVDVSGTAYLRETTPAVAGGFQLPPCTTFNITIQLGLPQPPGTYHASIQIVISYSTVHSPYFSVDSC